jgi:hypothetical protein
LGCCSTRCRAPGARGDARTIRRTMTRNPLTPTDVPPPAPGEERSRALALVNTALEPRGLPLELLPDKRALDAWLQAHGITPPRPTRLGTDGLERVQPRNRDTRQRVARERADSPGVSRRSSLDASSRTHKPGLAIESYDADPVSARVRAVSARVAAPSRWLRRDRHGRRVRSVSHAPQ